jgi:hypothetical protein
MFLTKYRNDETMTINYREYISRVAQVKKKSSSHNVFVNKTQNAKEEITEDLGVDGSTILK